MAKKTTPEVNEQKVQTKYDRKMEERRKKEAKDQRDEKIFKLVTRVLGIAIIAAIVIGIGTSVYSRYNALNGTYIKIGDREVSELEFDYYYNMSTNNYLATYSSILPYMGFDSTVDYDKQAYGDEGLTWKDMFEKMAVDQMTQYYALLDDAAANGFTYDVTADYDCTVEAMESSAETAGVSVSKYCKNIYGKYATMKNIESFMKDGLLATAYYNELLTKNTPSDEEVTAYYNENKLDYDKVDYRSFTFTADVEADASEEDITAAMADIKTKADAFMAARQGGEEFDALCAEYASEDVKANYEDTATEYSLTEGSYSSSLPTAISDWMYDDARVAGDIAVIEDTDYNEYYVVEFVNKYFDEADNDTISSTLSSESVTAYLEELVTGYEVIDEKGKLDYLAVEAAADEAAEDGTAEDAETEAVAEEETEVEAEMEESTEAEAAETEETTAE